MLVGVPLMTPFEMPIPDGSAGSVDHMTGGGVEIVILLVEHMSNTRIPKINYNFHNCMVGA